MSCFRRLFLGLPVAFLICRMTRSVGPLRIAVSRTRRIYARRGAGPPAPGVAAATYSHELCLRRDTRRSPCEPCGVRIVAELGALLRLTSDDTAIYPALCSPSPWRCKRTGPLHCTTSRWLPLGGGCDVRAALGFDFAFYHVRFCFQSSRNPHVPAPARRAFPHGECIRHSRRGRRTGRPLSENPRKHKWRVRRVAYGDRLDTPQSIIAKIDVEGRAADIIGSDAFSSSPPTARSQQEFDQLDSSFNATM
jgi:hypothetical protein